MSIHNKCEKIDTKHCKGPETFMENLNDIKDVYESIEDYNPRKERKVLVAFDMITDMINQ